MKNLLFIVTIMLFIIACGGNNDKSKTDEPDLDIADTEGMYDNEIGDHDEISDESPAHFLEDSVLNLTEEFLEFTNGAGVVVGVGNGESSFTVTAGTAHLSVNHPDPILDTHLFRIASITKTFVAMTVLKMVEDALLTLDDTLDNWYPDYPNADIITVKMLLNHTSGISDFSTLGTPEQIIESTVNTPPYFEPGADWAYSNTNYIFLGRIIEKISENRVSEEMRSRVIDPLGLTDTFFEPEEELPEMRLAGGHYYEDGSLIEETGTTVAWAAGAMVSSVGDLAKFARAIFNSHFLSQEMHKETMDFVEMSGDKVYSTGIMYYDLDSITGYGHGGNLVNFNGNLTYLPELDTTIVVQTNYPVSSDMTALIKNIIALLSDKETSYKKTDCTPPETIFDTTSPLYQQFMIAGNIENAEADEPQNTYGYFFHSDITAPKDFSCSNYVFSGDLQGTDYIIYFNSCPESKRYYTGVIKIINTIIAVPKSKMQSAKDENMPLIDSNIIYQRYILDYNLDTELPVKQCTLEYIDPTGDNKVHLCLDKSVDFSMGDFCAAYGTVSLTNEIPESQQCSCFDEQGNATQCKTFEEQFSCSIPENFFNATGKHIAEIKLVSPINNLAETNDPQNGTTDYTLIHDNEDISVDDYSNFAGVMTLENGDYAGKEVLVAQTVGNIGKIGTNYFSFNSTELYIFTETLESMIATEEQLLSDNMSYLFFTYAWEQKINDNNISFKKCLINTDDKTITDNKLFICNTDNISFETGETASILGDLTLTTDENVLNEAAGGSDLCLCFDDKENVMSCDDF